MGKLRLAIPKGRLYGEVKKLLEDSGIRLRHTQRQYRPVVLPRNLEVKIFKARNIAQLVSLGKFHLGFTGKDWLLEEDATDVVTLLETGFDRVNVVVAAPKDVTIEQLRSQGRVVVATEYPNLAKRWLDANGIDHLLMRTYGATEVFPPEDADIIIDNTASGRTLLLHNLRVLAQIMESETVLVASKAAMRNEDIRQQIEEFVILLKSVLLARQKVLLEMNISSELIEEILPRLPCMRAPTVAPLFGGKGYAVKIAVDKEEAMRLIPKLKSWGATDILQYKLYRILP